MRHIVFVLPPPSGALIVKRFKDPVPSHLTYIWGNIWEKPEGNLGEILGNLREIVRKSWGHPGNYQRNLQEIMGKIFLGN